MPENLRLLRPCSPRAATTVLTRDRPGRRRSSRLASEPIDLVLLDIVMPEIDGYEVCRRLRADAGDAASCRS